MLHPRLYSLSQNLEKLSIFNFINHNKKKDIYIINVIIKFRLSCKLDSSILVAKKTFKKKSPLK